MVYYITNNNYCYVIIAVRLQNHEGVKRFQNHLIKYDCPDLLNKNFTVLNYKYFHKLLLNAKPLNH